MDDQESEEDQEGENDQEGCTDSDATLEECFENLEFSTNGNYSPFPSKIFAMLYLLINSPRPAVSCFDDYYVFLFFMFLFEGRKDPLVHPKADAPSLVSVKAFQIPNIVTPVKVG